MIKHGLARILRRGFTQICKHGLARILLSVCICVFYLCSSVFSQKESKTSIETKIAIESSMENRLKKVLTEITGTEKIVVIVNVQLMSEKKEKAPAKKEDEMFLPGVPIKETLAERKVESVMMSALGDDTRTLIRKLSVTIILDKSVSSAVVEIVKKVSAGLLGIEPERGDELIIQQMNFQKNVFLWSSLIYPPNIYWIFAVLAAIGFTLTISMFLFGPFQKFAKDLVSAAVSSASSFKEKTAEASGGFASGMSLPEITAPSEIRRKELSASGKEPLFSFVNAENIKELGYLLKNESAKNIAIVTNYLTPELSARIFTEFPKDVKKDVVGFLSKVEELTPSEVEKLENHLKIKIDFLSGGEEKIRDIVNSADEQLQNEIISELKAENPHLAQKIEKSIVRLDILSSTDVSGLQLLIKQVGTAVFGQVLKVLPAAQQEKILSILPAGAATRLKQEMELGKSLTPQRLEIEKKRMLDIIRRMKERGLI
ncbi:MAG: FliG C-terminal domain-containing protein [Elusimicrobiota bacterium]|nr:FliG C-terminal domain-containing protein [Elusimicrobiota bacterium]